MKCTIKQILTILCLLVATGIHAQTIERKVINTMGGTLAPSGGPQLIHNVGETFSTTLVAGGYSLTQGFLQYSIVSVPPITGALSVCAGATTTLSDSMSGGTWASSNTSVATVGSTGIVTGVASGTAIISYTVAGGSATTVVTVSGTPTVTSVSPSIAIPAASATITGTNFNTTTTNNIVYFGATRATVNTANATSLNVTVPVGATYMPVTVLNTACALTGYSQYPFLPTWENSSFLAGIANFDPKVDVAAGNTPTSIAIGDVDGDGKADLVVSNWGLVSNTVSVYRNMSVSGVINASSFSSRVDFNTGTHSLSVILADIDGDGKLDIVTSNQSENLLSILRNTSTSGTINSSSFAGVVNFSADGSCYHLAASDIDGDGRTDIVVANGTAGFNSICVFRNTAVPGSITSSSLATPVYFATSGTARSLSLNDIDGDGRHDITVTSGANTVSVFRNIATSGVFNSTSLASRIDFALPGNVGALAVADIDGDLKNDLVVTNDSYVGIMRNIGTAGSVTSSTFAAAVNFEIESAASYIAVADINGDSKPDIATSNYTGNKVSVFVNTGLAGSITSGSMSTEFVFAAATHPYYIAIGDLDGDSKPDMVVPNGTSHNISILRNNPLSATTGTLTVCAGSSTALTNATNGGTWSSSNSAVATVGSATGLVIGVTSGTATISYTVAGGSATVVVTVNSLANAGIVTGISLIGIGGVSSLSSSVSGGSWSTSAAGIATVGSTGVVTGVAAGTATISYSVTNSCGTAVASKMMVVSNDTLAVRAWATYYGGSAEEGGRSVAVDAAGNIYVAGYSASASGIATSGAHQTTPGGGDDAYLVKFNGAGVRLWGTYYGGSGEDRGYYVATDALGNVYLTGTTTSSSGIATSGAHQTVFGGGPNDAFLAKFDSSGVRQWATYYGGSGEDHGGWSVATDAAGNVYMTGYTGNAGLATAGAHQVTPGGGPDGYLVKFNSAGVRRWATYYGGSGYDIARAAAVDGSGNIYMTGETSSTSGISTAGAHQTTYGGGVADAFLVKFDTAGVRQWGTYYGGTEGDLGVCVAVDFSGNVYASGHTVSTSGIASSGHQNTYGGGISDAFLTKFNSSGIRQWATYYGGTGSDAGIGVTTDGGGNVYLTGYTYSTTGIATGSAHQTALGGNSDSYIARFSSSGARQWATYYGAAGNDEGMSVTADDLGHLYMFGRTGSTSGIASTGAHQFTYGGGTYDGFLVRFSSMNAITGTLTVCAGSSTTLTNATTGGTWSSSNAAIATVGSATGVVTGVAGGTAAISYTVAGGSATTVVTVNPIAEAGPITGSSSLSTGSTITLANATTGGTWSSSNTSIATVGSTGVVTGITPGTVTISYTVSNACGSAVATKVVTVNSAISSPITGTLTTCIGATTTLSNAATGGTWSSSTPAVATIGSASGIVTGVSAGTSTITYTMGGSYVTAVVTVYAMPAAITGGGSACVGATITLACTTTGGSWSSSNTAKATVGSTGIVMGVSSGTAVISYTISGACSSTKTITINASPSAIGGTLNGCIAMTNTLTCTPSGGAWSSSTPSVANINTTGQATGIAAGTTTITYGLSTGCRSTAVLTINALPDSVSGTAKVCAGLTTVLTGYPSGGNWSSSNTAKATVDAPGIVTGVALGTARITYTNAGGCYKTKVVTVNAAPLAITGTAAVCVGNSTTLASPGGGTWVSGTTSVATIGSTTGVVTGVSAGTATITYRLSTGCINTRVVTVNDAPTAITGTANICAGTTTTLTSTPSGGTWSSSGLTVGTVGSTTGVVTGLSGGAVTISYTIAGGCRATRVVTVNNNPPAIGGTATLATGGTTTLTNILTGGAWSSGNTSVATVGGIGVVYGVSSGTAQISYTSAAGCSITKTVTVSGAIGGITGVTTLCTGTTTSLSCSPAGGTWSSGNTAVATVTSTGVVSGVSPGTATISYSISGTTTTTVVTVYAAPAAIAGPGLACVGGTITLSNSVSGGTWSSSNTAAATIGSAGMVSGIVVGTTIISYQMAAGCGVAKTITVNATPSAITGTLTVCVGVSATLSCTPAGGAWSSETPSVANIDASGTYTGASAGTTTITYGMGTGCFSTTTVTVNAVPGTISGTLAVCEGATSSLTTSTSGGTWSSSNTSVATIDASGLVTAVAAGNTTIAYSTGSGCAVTASFTVNPTPSAIGGSLSLCIGNSSTLTNASAGGTWSSSNTSVGTISPSVGTLTGISAGVTTISYTATSGCVVTASATVNDLPGTISGSLEVCASGGTATLTCTPSGGTWSTTTPSVATIGSSTGVVTGVSAGTAFITYTVGSGCYSVTTITINAIPSAITGAANVCPGTTTTLASTTTGGTWSSGTPSVATVNTSGMVSGVSVGTSLISYTVNGCATTRVVTVNALPSAISGASILCSGITQTFSATPSGGTWSSSNTSVGSINSTTGAFIGLISGNTTVTYKLATGCQSELVLTINPSPAAISGATTLCLGTAITLSTSTTGGAWSSGNPAVASVNTSGIVTGNTIGTANISYTLGSCHAVKQVTVNTAFTSSTTFNMCLGSTKTLVDSLPGGTWSSSTPAVATVVAGTGVAAAMSVGMTTITYFFGTGCSKTTPLYVQNSNAVISGPSTICETSTATMTVPSASMGGSWTSSNPSVATINMSTGALNAVSPGVVTISYTLVECITTKTVTVNPRPSAITGTQFACIGSTTTLANTTSGGSWTSSTSGIATVGSASGVVTGVAAGTATISYTLATGCNRTAVVTIATTPATITGTTNVCVGNTITLGCTSPGGTWSSGNSAIASVGSSTGVVSGVGAGVTTISYGYGGSCVSTKVVTVNATPAAITGPGVVCAGQTINLANALTPGTWSSSAAGVATANSSTGLITGVASGTATISYRTSVGGCLATTIVTVNAALPAITGGNTVCVGNVVTLNIATTGGAWSSSAVTKATIDGTSGVVTGVATGSSIITYLVSPGCFKTSTMLVHPLPSAISGASSVVVGSSTTLTCATSGGAWSSSNTAIGTVGSASGAVTGISVGAVTITFTKITTGCFTTKAMTVNPVTLAKPGSGLMSSSDVRFSVYPNPNHGTLTIDAAVSGVFRIYTVDSRLVTEHNISAPSTVIQLPQDLASGVYLCRFTGVDGSTETVRLVYDPK